MLTTSFKKTSSVVESAERAQHQLLVFQVERTARLLFLWKMEAFEKRTEVEKIRLRNRKLVDNILPEHVADYFLQHQSKDETVIIIILLGGVVWQ